LQQFVSSTPANKGIQLPCTLPVTELAKYEKNALNRFTGPVIMQKLVKYTER
jgi:hypothetical protein